MKNKFFKRILITLCFAVFAFASAIGVAVSVLAPASAESTALETGVFEMDDGVSLQFSKVGGMRFIVRMDKTVYDYVNSSENVELGFIIAPKNLMVAANGDYLNMPKKIGGAIDKGKIYQDGGYYLANGCITNIKYANLERDFVAVAYVKEYSGDTVTALRYTDYNDLARNNLYDLVNMATLNGYASEIFNADDGYSPYVTTGAEDADGWYGTEEFPIVIESTEEYDELVAAANNDVDFSNYNAVINNDATPTNDYVDDTKAPNIISGGIPQIIRVENLIKALPDSVVMPDGIGMIGRIRAAEDAYNALSDGDKASVSNYAKLESLLTAIEGYDRVYKNDATDGTVIPSYVPNYTSTLGGSASVRQDEVYGNVLTVTSDAEGKAALSFTNFPSTAKYAAVYFYVKVSVGCDLYLSDGTSNDGKGKNDKNTWSVPGLWCNADNWRLVTVYTADGYIGTDFALGFRTDTTGFTFEISDFYGIVAEKGMATTSLPINAEGTTSIQDTYGFRIYNFTQEYVSDNDLDSFPAGTFASALRAEHDTLKFYIYNPSESTVSAYFTNTSTWQDENATTLQAKAWTEFVITPDTVDSNKTADMVFVAKGIASTAGWQISPIYSLKTLQTTERKEASLSFGNMVDSGETNEYGTVYDISREQWYIDNNKTNTIGTLQASKLANALPTGYEYFYFWMYNGTDTEYNFHLAGDVSGTWTDSAVSTALKVGVWTQVVISAADIELNKNGQWYVYILGGDGQGAAKDGWKISTIYAGPDVEAKTEFVYLDHADVKDVIALINALPETATLSDKTAVEAARAAYDNLTAEQQTLVDATKLVNAENTIGDIESANEVIALIDAINAYDVDESMVSEARAAYNGLTDGAKALVTNLSTLESYEAELAKAAKVTEVIEMIAVLPDSVTMPDHLVYVPRIEAARDAYFALEAEDKEKVDNYTKLRSLIASIKGYTTVYRQSLDGASVIPSHVPNYTSTTGGSASIAEDSYYGNYLRVTPDAGGNGAVQFVNFPDVSQYSKLYFNVRVVGASCDIYLSDGISNDGWGDNWHNTWSLSGFWANDGSWIQKEVEVSTGIFSSNWALGLRTSTPDVYFEITDIVGWAPEFGTDSGLTFGTFTDSGTTNEYGTVYNFSNEGWDKPETDMGAFNANALSGALATGHDSFHFWIYNPNESDVVFYANENETWIQTELATLTANAWTEVVLTPAIVESNNTYLTYMCVTTGGTTAGWQISPIYSFNSQSVSADAVADVQALIDALDSQSSSTEAVQAARLAYEALTEAEKKLVGVDNLISCEEQLWTDGEGTSGTPFIVDGASNYKIYYEAGLKEIATFMQKHIKEATGARLPLVSAKPETITQYRYAIVIGYNDLLNTNLGCDIPASGYVLRLIGRTVCIVADRSDNYRMGGLAFLSETIGYSMIAEDCVIYNPDTEIMTPVDEEAAPSFAYRQQQTYMTDDELLGMGLQSHTDLWIPSDQGWDMHNALHYLPVATYGTEHPNWYTSDQTQICPTAGGTATEFNAMVDVIVANMMTQINKYPEQENISFSIMDSAGDDACTCTRCTLYTTLYGEGGFSAAWIDLMNAINEKIQAQISERKLNVAFLAYRSTEKAPANDDLTLQYRYEINDDGSYTQTSEYLKCDDEVMVWLAPIDGKYAENFEHADNAATLATIKKWCALSGNVFLWMYGANFKNYMYPYNTWQANAENYTILAGLGVKGVWSQSNETEGTAFSDLKAYIDSQFLCNVNVNYEGVLNNYFTNYFGEGAEKMRAMFDAIVKKCNEIEETYGLGRGIYDEIENTTGILGIGGTTYWSQEWINSLVTLCDEAKAAVNADTTLTDEQKAVILNRITKESLFPRFVLCTSFASKYSSSAKKTLRQEFKADAEALGLTLYKEADGLLSDLYSDWGI